MLTMNTEQDDPKLRCYYKFYQKLLNLYDEEFWTL